MKTSIFKRSMALLLAFLLCFTTFIGSAVTPAFAAGTESEVVLIGFPRDGDDLYHTGNWGNEAMTLMNGWAVLRTRQTVIRSVGSYYGPICYCLEPGVPLNSGDRLLAQKTTKDYERESRNRRQRLQELIARNKEVDRLFERIYEDNVSGKLTDERFMKMSQRYDEEQQQLKKDIEELQSLCDKEDNRAFCKDQFLKAVRKFMEMKTLTPTILHELVERIDVYQTQGRGKNRTQRIVIHYNFIGVLDMPEVEEYPDNVVLDSRQGVAVEYLVGKAG